MSPLYLLLIMETSKYMENNAVKDLPNQPVYGYSFHESLSFDLPYWEQIQSTV